MLQYLVQQLSSQMTMIKSIPWFGVTFHGPEKQSVFQGSQFVEQVNTNLTMLVTRNGNWLMRQSHGIDYSYCKKSKYN